MTEEIEISTEDFIKQFLEKDRELSEHVDSTSCQDRIDNIKQIRDLVKHFILISSGIIGITIPVLGRIDFVKDLQCLRGALFILLIIVLYSFYYLTRILSKENKGLEEQYNKFTKILDKRRNYMYNFMRNRTQENLQQFIDNEKKGIRTHIEKDEESRHKKQKSDYSLDIIFWSFFVSLVLIVVSIL